MQGSVSLREGTCDAGDQWGARSTAQLAVGLSQVFKFIYCCRLAEMGLATQAFHYCEVIAKSVLAQPRGHSLVLLRQLVQVTLPQRRRARAPRGATWGARDQRARGRLLGPVKILRVLGQVLGVLQCSTGALGASRAETWR